MAFVIPTYVHDDLKLYTLKRLLKSIYHFYPEAKEKIILVYDDEETLSKIKDIQNVVLKANPHPGSGVFGALKVFQTTEYEKAFLLHDNMVIANRVPDDWLEMELFFPFSFPGFLCVEELGIDCIKIIKEIKELNPQARVNAEGFFRDYGLGWRSCFGPAFYISKKAVGILDAEMKLFSWIEIINDAHIRQLMERMFGYLCFQTQLVTMEKYTLNPNIFFGGLIPNEMAFEALIEKQSGYFCKSLSNK